MPLWQRGSETVSVLFTEDFWYMVLRCTTPILFATLAALIANTAGLMNLGLEGSMTVSALFGALGCGFTGSIYIGLLYGMAAGILVTMLLAFCVMRLGANRIIAGVALNLACTGGSVFLLYTITGDKTSTNALPSSAFPSVPIPLVSKLPVIGKILSGHNVFTYIAFLSAIFLYFVLKSTKFGVKVRAVGEMPAAAESVGIKVNKIRYEALLLSGMFASLGGIYLSMGYVSRFTSGMVAGRGYIALATNAMAASNPLLAVGSSLLYGFGNALSIYQQNNNNDPYLVELIPYVFIIVSYTLISLLQKRREQRLAQ